MPRKFTKTYKIIATIVKLPFIITTKRHWYGTENLPETGGFIAVANHVTDFDSMTFMHYLVNNNIPVRIMAKAELFKVPLLGRALKATGQIPVNRSKNKNSTAVLSSARKALMDGECIAIFPEGTLTKDPQRWPMKAKTGAARLALQTRVPVIPVAQWGAHKICDPDNKVYSFFPPKDVTVLAGKPVYLADLYGKENDIQALHEASDRIIRQITFLLSEIRCEKPPKNPYNYSTNCNANTDFEKSLEKKILFENNSLNDKIHTEYTSKYTELKFKTKKALLLPLKLLRKIIYTPIFIFKIVRKSIKKTIIEIKRIFGK